MKYYLDENEKELVETLALLELNPGPGEHDEEELLKQLDQFFVFLFFPCLLLMM